MDLLTILPEILLIVFAAILIIVDLRLKRAHKELLAYVTFGGLALIFALTVIFNRPEAGAEAAIWGGMLRHDMLAFVFRLVFLAGAALTALSLIHI